MPNIDIINCLCNTKKLERDTGMTELQRILPSCDDKSRLHLQSSLLQALTDSSRSWESRLGCLLGVKSVLLYTNFECEKEAVFSQQIQAVAQKFLADEEEARVRMASGEVLGALCSKKGPSVFLECRDLILKLIQQGVDGQAESIEIKINPGPAQRRASADLPGWGALEASLRALQAMVEGCGPSFATHVNPELLGLLSRVLKHKSRGVREAGFYLTASIASCSIDGECHGGETGAIFELGHTLLPSLTEGLADDWSPVRLAASVAVRRFLLSLPHDNSREIFYTSLLPRMCLNRYYAAEGVRIYSQETWRQLAGCAGRELVEQNLQAVVDYYSESTRSSSHAVREAACSCIAELANKLHADSVRPHVPHLLKTLLHCFQDDSWPVRDAACLACGNFVLSFPTESEVVLPELYPMFFRNLEDSIPSVRAGAAAALGSVVRVRKEEALAPVLSRIEEGLQGIAKQPSDIPDHSTTSQHNLCGSITPKLGRASSTDHRYHRPPQPWEMADGCVSLLAELATLPYTPAQVTSVLPLLAQACMHHHYSAHLTFLETVCRYLPSIARGVGKKAFKTHLEGFFEPVFYALESENALTSSAASQCLNHISAFLGANVLRARVQAHSPNHLRHLDANLFIAPF